MKEHKRAPEREGWSTPMNSRRDSTDGPEDVDAAFAEIVASLEREGVGAHWPDEADEHTDHVAVTPVDEEPSHAEGRPSQADPEPHDDDHFVPPEPPPLPALRPGTIAALVLMAVGVVLLVAPGLFGLQSRIGTPLSLVALCGGVGWLILRLRHGPPPDSGWDDGAQL
jgi:hypothetical protein